MPTYPTSSTPMANQVAQPRLAPPADVLMSVKLWFASIAIGLVGGIAAFVLTDQTAAVQTMADADTTGLTDAQLQTAVTIGLVIALVVSVIILALQILFVFMMKAGHNWARILLTVLAGLSALMTLASLTQGFTLSTATSLLSLVVIIAAVVFMYRPAANPYFSKRLV